MSMNRRDAQQGVTILEILVAILIISFGLLGTAGMQAIGLKASVSANQRTAATLLAYDAADRMRANMGGVAAGAYHNYTATTVATCLSAGCSTSEMAQNDMAEWNAAIAAALPSGIGIVCRDSSPDDGSGNGSVIVAGCDGIGNAYVIKIWWLEDRSSSNPTAALKRFVTQFQP
jgi:type IV pilus assembly protein PilV